MRESGESASRPRGEPARERRFRATPLLVCAALSSAWALWTAFLQPVPALLRFTPDDSFFYYQIAWNFPHTHRFSYDGLHDTYGFQPLWQIVLALLAGLFEERVSFFRFGIALQGALHVGAGVAIHRLLRRHAGAQAAIAGAAFWLLNPLLLEWTLAGKENGLYLCILIAIGFHLDRRYLRSDGSRPRGFALGALLGLLILARVNSALFAAMLAPILAFSMLRLQGRTLRDALAVIATAAATATASVLPWLVYARVTFGQMMPASGSWKIWRSHDYVARNWGADWLSPDHIATGMTKWPGYLGLLWHAHARPVTWFVVIALAAVLARRIGASRTRVAPVVARGPGIEPASLVLLGTLAAWAALNSLANVTLLPKFMGYARWYAVPELLLFTIAFGILAQAFVRAVHAAWQPALVAALFLAASALAGRFGSSLGLPRLAPGWELGAVLLAFALAAWAAARAGRAVEPRSTAAAIGAALCIGGAWPEIAAFDAARTGADGAGASSRTQLYETALWAREHVPEDVQLAAWDSGIFTYFSERRVISLEGLVSDPFFIETGRLDRQAYIRAKRIQYVVGPGLVDERGRFVFPRLPEGSYRVEWVPFPDRDLGWGRFTHYMLVRPLSLDAREAPEVLARGDFSFGAFRPNERRAAARPGAASGRD